MYKKECPECGEVSQTAIIPNVWRCPYCGHDLNEEETQKDDEDIIVEGTSEGVERDPGSDCEGGACPVK